MTVHLLDIAPQLLVDDLEVALAHYRDRLGFRVDFQYQDFYAGVSRDGARLHLKCAPKSAHERRNRARNDHLDAYISVDEVAPLYEELCRRGADVISPLALRPWQCHEFWVRDADGYILAFSQQLE